MRKLLSLLCILAGLCLGCRSVSASTCNPVPGAELLWSMPSLHWLLLGEVHGTNETPDAFIEIACNALSRGKKLTVALERASSEQAALEAILTSPDLVAAKKSLLAQPDWANGMDGRASEAMLRLLLSLRELHNQYKELSVFAFEAPFEAESPGTRDAAMGKSLLALGRSKPDNLILVLSGNVHAMKTPMFGTKVAAMFLPEGQTLSLQVLDRGGATWITSRNGCGASPGGAPDKAPQKPFGIYLDPKLARYGTVDGILALGKPVTASPPAAGIPSPAPECRNLFLEREGHPSEQK